MKCEACKGSGRSNNSGRWLHCAECFGHGQTFETIPTEAELIALEFSQDIARQIILKWTKYFEENPTPKPRALSSRLAPPTLQDIIGAGYSPEAAGAIYTREQLKAANGIKPYGDRDESDLNAPPGIVEARASRTVDPNKTSAAEAER